MLNKPYLSWGLHLGLFLGLTFTTNTQALAQVTADPTLGTQVEDSGLRSFISGGTTVDNTNLFHSFSTFNIPNGGAAIFSNDTNIANIFARVTGGSASDIQGLIRAQGSANLFLMNPNGIIFGRNAQLRVGGSFVATTANAIQFPGGAEFSMTSPVTPGNNLLSVNPTAFLFNQIANQGANSIENRGFLRVPDNKSLILLGGRVAPTSESSGQILIDGGILAALSGRVEIGGLAAPGSVEINFNSNNLSLNLPDNVARTDISLVNNSGVFVFGNGGGDILVNANNLRLLNNTSFFAGIVSSQGKADAKSGDISINATGNVTLTERSSLGNVALERGNTGDINIVAKGIITLAQNSTLGNMSSAIGNSGDINIVAQSLNVIDGSLIRASATEGNSGAVNITVNDTVSLAGRGAIFPGETLSSSITSSVGRLDTSPENILGTPTTGTSGGVNIKARDLSLADGAIISASTTLADDSGDIKIKADNSVILNGAFITSSNFGIANAGDLFLTSDRLVLMNNSKILFDTFGTGNAGDININSRDILINNSSIEASLASFSGIISDAGNAGTINIKTERILITNLGFISTSSDQPEPGETFGSGGDINITSTGLIEIDAQGRTETLTGIIARTFSNSRGGEITLNTKDLIVRDGGVIAVDAASNSQGNAGDIYIFSQDEVLIKNNSSIRASATQSDGGTINIIARIINLRNNGDIRTELSSGNGGGGDIFLTADTIIALEDSDILAFAPEGQGGNITFNTRALFSDSLFNPTQTSIDRNSLESLNNNGRSDINASGAISGNIIGVPDVSFIQNGLTELQNNIIDTNALIANSCIARSSKLEGSFVITGTGGLPTRPGEAVASSFPTGDVQNVSNHNADSSWKKGDQIIEPEGVYRLANGDLVMSRECN